MFLLLSRISSNTRTVQYVRHLKYTGVALRPGSGGCGDQGAQASAMTAAVGSHCEKLSDAKSPRRGRESVCLYGYLGQAERSAKRTGPTRPNCYLARKKCSEVCWAEGAYSSRNWQRKQCRICKCSHGPGHSCMTWRGWSAAGLVNDLLVSNEEGVPQQRAIVCGDSVAICSHAISILVDESEACEWMPNDLPER